MRGWTHYLSGLAMAMFFPPLLSDLVKGVMWPVLAGVSAYLPDFLDFKFKKFLWRVDYLVDPAPRDPLRKLSPRRIRVSELSQGLRWRLYYLEGRIEDVLEEREGYARFKLADETGSVVVVARNGDYEKLRRMLGSSIKELAASGRRVRIPGYLEVDEGGSVYWNVADAPHPQYVADAVARAIDEAYETGRMVTVKIHNIRMPGDFYRRFLIQYDSKNRRIIVHMGPLVSTGGLPLEGTEPPEYRRIGVAETKHAFRKVYPRPTVIDAFSGPEIGYEKVGDVVEEVFIPWHRGFSHSLTASVVIGGLIGLATLALGYANWFYLAVASMLGHAMHVLEDQLGFMGSVLFPPLTKRRIPGLMLGPSRQGLINFATNWLMLALAAWNVNRFMPEISPGMPKPIELSNTLPVTPAAGDALLLLLLALPAIAIYAWGVLDRRRFLIKQKERLEEEKAKEAVEEAYEEVGGY
ncbi:metal-dependent hydrolase [Thermosphaera chiliense]|uniref:Metal-dependent hydrolase n=1 Tax=Thermosphaera chiliense TaxID=3402707 RepID=A0A7M1UQH0_9CREN|nr:metal-dependent hydrolase [Thermosphaera aggregans]QOR94495.1 metal-dependent hydrolase [Thermosphaera aggregans]